MAGAADEKPATPTSAPKGTTPKGTPRPKPPSALIGQTISDRYKIERLLGEGGMGAVYQAEHTLMRKRMAIKVLHPEMTRLPEVVARFEREAMAAAHIDHPHVVTATDFGKLEDGSFFLALEFVEGKSLREVIAKGRLELGRALHIGRQIAAALSRAHQLKIVHRDLKPENVMLVTRDGDPDFVKVLDFGIAKVQIGELTSGEERGPGQPVLTQAGMVYGTPEYMAPEQALGQPVDARADLYALGCILYEMLCGVRPFDAESKVALLGMQVTAPVPPMAQKAPDASIPPEVEALVRKLLAKEANERTADAREVIEGLANILTPLVTAGRIDAGYAPPQSSRFTNPSLVSGVGSSPDISLSPDASVRIQAAAPVPTTAIQGLLGNKTWLIAAGGGLVGILVLVITIVVVVRGHDTNVDAEGGTAVVDGGEISADAEQKIKEAITQIDKGNYGSGIDSLESLGPEAGNREDVHLALLKAYANTNKHKEAMREVGLVLQANPSVSLTGSEGVFLRTEVRDTALLEGIAGSDQGAVNEAYGYFNGKLGAVGYDDLYDIAYGKSGVNYPKAVARARAELAKSDRTKMSPALAVTVDLSSVLSNCQAIKVLLDRAADNGDERTLFVLRPLMAPRMVGASGFRRGQDALGCIHEGSLSKTIAAIEARTKKR
jgi:eukaryotic-like serine/threonine-protein kinase